MSTSSPDTAERYERVPLSALIPSPTNPRKTFDEDRLAELAASIRSKDIIEPLVVRPNGKAGMFEIIAGERRWRAAKLAGRVDAPCIIRNISDAEVLHLQVIENLQRDDVHPMDEASGYRLLLKSDAKATPESIAAEIGKSKSYVYQRLQLLKLIEPLQKCFLAGDITPGHAVELARLTARDQEALLKQDLFEHAWNGTRRERGGAISVRSLRAVIQRAFHLDLAKVLWSLADAEIVKTAGACTACPKRSGSNPALYADISKADICTDRACYDLKLLRSAERRKAELAATGTAAVLISVAYARSGNDEKRLRAQNILWRNDYGSSDDGWREAGKQKCDHTVKGVIADGGEIGAVKLVCTKPATCRVHRTVRDERTGVTHTSAAQKRRMQEQRIETDARRRTLDAILGKIRSPLNADDLRSVVQHMFRRLYNPMDKEIVKALGWLSATKTVSARGAQDHDRVFCERLPTLALDELAQMAIRILLWSDTSAGPQFFGGRENQLAGFAKRYHVNTNAITRRVREEFKSRAAGKSAVQTSARPPAAPGGKSKASATVAQCKAVSDRMKKYWAERRKSSALKAKKPVIAKASKKAKGKAA